MQAFLKSAAVALACLGIATSALAIDTAPRDNRAQPGGPSGPGSASPLAALGGSTFDPRSLTGAVTLERLLTGLRGMDGPGNDRLMEDKSPGGASDDSRMRRALMRAGVFFSYQAYQVEWEQPECRGDLEPKLEAGAATLGLAQRAAEICRIRITERIPLGEPVWLQATLARRGLANATFLVSGPSDARDRVAASAWQPSCRPLEYMPEREVAAPRMLALKPGEVLEESIPKTKGTGVLLRLVGHFDPIVFDRAKGGGKDTAQALALNKINRCVSVDVWSYEQMMRTNAGSPFLDGTQPWDSRNPPVDELIRR